MAPQWPRGVPHDDARRRVARRSKFAGRSSSHRIAAGGGIASRTLSRWRHGFEPRWPSWSPDGTRILFSSIRDDCAYSEAPDCKTTGDIGPYHTLYVMNADGSDQTRISDAFGQIADWSPDGRFIVFETSPADRALNVIRIDASGLTTIPIRASSAGFPDWIS